MARAAGSMALCPRCGYPECAARAREREPETHHPLVRTHDAELGRLADDHAPRQPLPIGVASR